MIQFILLIMIINYIPNHPMLMDILAWGGLAISVLSFGIKLGSQSKD